MVECLIMVMQGHITYQGDAKIAKAQLKKIIKAGLAREVKFWHRTYMPRHFTIRGHRIYKYKLRSGQRSAGSIIERLGGRLTYMGRKLRYHGHIRPLVLTGLAETMAKAAVRVTSRGRGKTGTITSAAVMQLPKYFYQYRKDLNQPDKADELTRTVETEVKVQAKRFERFTAKKIDRIKKKRRVRL